MKKAVILKMHIDVCNLHASRIEMALAHIKHLLPLQPLQLTTLPDIELGFMELLTSRFAKLQDTIGSRIFPLVLELLQEDASKKSFLDRLHRLEALGILNSAQEWITMREVRNSITHEYPDNPELVASNLNKAIEYAKWLLVYWSDLQPLLNKLPN